MDVPLYRRLKNVGQKVMISARYYGVDMTVLYFVPAILSRFKIRKPMRIYKALSSQRLDARLGVDTAGVITPEHLDIDGIRKRQAVQYQPTGSLSFGLALANLPINHSDYVFVDYGSGKGRALFLAAQFPFKKCVGVELSRNLHRICEDNIGRLRSKSLKCRDIRSICCDAASFPIPEEPAVLYFFQPFNRDVFSIVLGNILRSLRSCPRDLLVLYYHPGLEDHIGQTDFLYRVRVDGCAPGWDVLRAGLRGDGTIEA